MPAQPTGLETKFLELVNGTRANAGVSPLTFDNALMIAADNHSAWMDATDTISNTGASGSSPESIWYFYGTDETGETAAATRHFVEDAHRSLVNSDYQNLVNPNFHEVGIGLLEGDYLGYPAVFATLDFAA
jgi:serralysin